MKRFLMLFFCLFIVLTLGMSLAEEREIVIIDNDNVVIKVLEFESSSSSFNIKVYLENKTDSTIMFSIDKASVNGISYDPFWAKEVAAGKKAKNEISWDSLKSHGINNEISVVCGTIRAYDSDDWGKEDYANEEFALYPLGEEKVATETRESKTNDIVIVDNEYCTIIATNSGPDQDGWYAYTIDLYLVNKTDSAMMIGVDDVSVDGYMCDPFWAAEVPANCQEYSRIEWSESMFTENGIDDVSEISEIELTFRAYNSDDWSTDDYYKAVSLLKPING